MKKERDWLDYANLGSKPLNKLRMIDVSGKLGAMAAVAAGGKARAGYEDQIREVVFERDTLLDLWH